MNPDIWQSPDIYAARFWQGIERQLESDSLGALILAAANISFDASVFSRLQDRILERLQSARQRVARELRRGVEPDDAPDDLAVLLRLITAGFDWLSPSRQRECGPWQLSLHPLRAFRPKRGAGAEFRGLRQPFRTDRFHFNKPFLTPEIFWDGDLLGTPATLLYNKFPFIDLHGLLVPEREAQRPQFLSGDLHLWAAEVAFRKSRTLPGLGLAYNSNGAMASVNHLHLQSFLREAPFPVESKAWRHNGGSSPYPLAVSGFDDAREAWDWIERRHESNLPYNLLYRGSRIWCIARRPQQAELVPPWSPGLAWAEVCGCFSTSDAEAFDHLDEAGLQQALDALREG